MCDPMQLADRFETLTTQIEKRIYDHTLAFDPSQSVRQWLSNLHRDQDLIAWDRERMHLIELLPLGYFDS